MDKLALLILFFASQASAVQNGLARTPQMGWNNWNSLGCDVSEGLLLDTASNLVGLGLRDVGYTYVLLDDCWSDGRGKDGKIIVDKQRFPSGMKSIASKIHDLGLLYGMYSSAGELTCARYEGSLDHEQADAESWASWDVDYLKYDNCYAMGRVGTAEASFKRYNTMAKALNATGRPILYSLCSWGEDYVNSWGVSIANSYRISGDIYDSFSAQTTYAHVHLLMLLVHTVSLLDLTARSSPSLIAWLRTSIEARLVVGKTWICSRLVMVA